MNDSSDRSNWTLLSRFSTAARDKDRAPLKEPQMSSAPRDLPVMMVSVSNPTETAAYNEWMVRRYSCSTCEEEWVVACPLHPGRGRPVDLPPGDRRARQSQSRSHRPACRWG